MTTVGILQGCLLSPILLNLFQEKIMQETPHDHHTSFSVGERPICYRRFADKYRSYRRQQWWTSRPHNRHVDEQRHMEWESTHTPLSLFFFQFELFSSGRDLVISPRLSPPAIRSRAPTAAGHSLFLLASTGCCSNLVVYSMLLCESGTVYSLKEEWLLCRDISAFNMCHFCCHTAGVVCASSYERSCVFSRNCEWSSPSWYICFFL